MPRTARFHGVPFKMPETFPIATQAPARAICWLEEQAPDKVEAAVLALYRAYFVDGKDISSPVATAEVLGSLGVDALALQAALNDPAIKERLKTQTQSAIERGVFGSPFVFVDGEPFWGTDRFEQIERWLSRGGF
jgi:2-hydroxychromene-2-carboxylate isomerase